RAVFNLAIPRFTRADFKELSTPAARDAYTQREINAFGDLDTLMANSQTYIDTLSDALGKIETYLRAKNPVSITDFYLFPILNSLTIVKDFPYSPALRGYLEHVSMSCDVPLFTDKAL
ncbi:MAG: glutaredoxin, partial [Leclercia adecarboxylata]|nr:glutaredoxin [Leclercia adecarboxylata]